MEQHEKPPATLLGLRAARKPVIGHAAHHRRLYVEPRLVEPHNPGPSVGGYSMSQLAVLNSSRRRPDCVAGHVGLEVRRETGKE